MNLNYTSNNYYTSLARPNSSYVRTGNNDIYAIKKSNILSKSINKVPPKPSSNVNFMNKKPMNINNKQQIFSKIKKKENDNNSNNLLSKYPLLFKEIKINDKLINDNIIPKYVFQTWKSKYLTTDMKQNILKLREKHNGFEFYLYDDEMCRTFIKNNYNKDVLHAFDSLIPGAFKADLWRYCILYKYGGIYMDIKLNILNDFRLRELLKEEHFPIDIPHGQPGVWQGLLVCKPKNKILKMCIDSICMHVIHKFYGKTCLSVTGPHLMYNILYKQNELELHHKSKIKLIRNGELYLYYNNKPIINFYNKYIRDKRMIGQAYFILWTKKQIYK